MGKKKNFLSAGSRFSGAFLAAIFGIVVALILTALTSWMQIVPDFISNYLIIALIINVIYYILINWFAAKGGIVGKIAFCLCLLVDVLYFVYCFGINDTDNFAKWTAVPFLLNIYVVDYLNWTRRLNGYSRHKYGVYSAIIIGIISMILYFATSDYGTVIGKIVGFGIHGITIYAFASKNFPFAREETVTVNPNRSRPSSSSTFTVQSNSNSNGRTGGINELRRRLENNNLYEDVYYHNGSCTVKTEVRIENVNSDTIRIFWNILIYDYNRGATDAIQSVGGNDGIEALIDSGDIARERESVSYGFRDKVQSVIDRFIDQTQLITRRVIDEVKANYSDLNYNINYSSDVNQIS